MEPEAVTIAAAFGNALLELLLSRDKRLNDMAQQNALKHETYELENLRNQMASNKRFDSHYQILGTNKDAIQYLDQKIEAIFKKKSDLIQRYAQMTIKESAAIIDGKQLTERKVICDKLKKEIDTELKLYDKKLEQLQKNRASLWEVHSELQDYLLDQEKKRDRHLDVIYKRHTGVLEKIYLRNIDSTKNIAKQTIDVDSQAFKKMIMAPMQYFSPSSGVSPDQAKKEIVARGKVVDLESDINDADRAGTEIPFILSVHDEEPAELAI